jgi:hypothetical protein
MNISATSRRLKKIVSAEGIEPLNLLILRKGLRLSGFLGFVSGISVELCD